MQLHCENLQKRGRVVAREKRIVSQLTGAAQAFNSRSRQVPVSAKVCGPPHTRMKVIDQSGWIVEPNVPSAEAATTAFVGRAYTDGSAGLCSTTIWPSRSVRGDAARV